jgi:hypothetical protein
VSSVLGMEIGIGLPSTLASATGADILTVGP